MMTANEKLAAQATFHNSSPELWVRREELKAQRPDTPQAVCDWNNQVLALNHEIKAAGHPPCVALVYRVVVREKNGDLWVWTSKDGRTKACRHYRI